MAYLLAVMSECKNELAIECTVIHHQDQDDVLTVCSQSLKTSPADPEPETIIDQL